jgi:hypothetical protein
MKIRQSAAHSANHLNLVSTLKVHVNSQLWFVRLLQGVLAL